MKSLIAILIALTLASCASTPSVEILRYPLKHAHADRVMAVLAPEFMRDRQRIHELVAEARTNSIIAKGNKEDLALLERRIRELDVP
jgi:Bacterial type II/III secretion system short domain